MLAAPATHYCPWLDHRLCSGLLLACLPSAGGKNIDPEWMIHLLWSILRKGRFYNILRNRKDHEGTQFPCIVNWIVRSCILLRIASFELESSCVRQRKLGQRIEDILYKNSFDIRRVLKEIKRNWLQKRREQIIYNCWWVFRAKITFLWGYHKFIHFFQHPFFYSP